MKGNSTKVHTSQQMLHKLSFLQKLGCQKPCWYQARLSSLVNKQVRWRAGTFLFGWLWGGGRGRPSGPLASTWARSLHAYGAVHSSNIVCYTIYILLWKDKNRILCLCQLVLPQISCLCSIAGALYKSKINVYLLEKYILL